MWLSFAAGLVLASTGTANAPDRLTQIWNAVEDRMTDQVDTWFEEGDFPKSIQLLRFQNEMSPADYDIATNLGWMLENVEDYPGATAVYEKFRKFNVSDPDASMPLAEMYYRKRNFAQTITILEPVIGKKKGMHPNNYRMLATSYERTKKYKESIRTWKTYINIAPNDLQAKANLARVEKKLQSDK